MDELIENFERAIRHIKKSLNKRKPPQKKSNKKRRSIQATNETKKKIKHSPPKARERQLSRKETDGSFEKRKKPKKKLTKQEIEKRKKAKQKKELLEIIRFFIPVVILAILVFFFILKTSSHMVDGDSMLPTLHNGDKVIIKRTKIPKRYEVITFKPPVKSDYQYVKRTIGMPGDAIWTKGTILYINQKEKITQKDITEGIIPDGTVTVTVSEACLEQLSAYSEIPSGHYFVLGDNRENSSDSREFGLIEAQAIEGVVSYRFAPFKTMGWIK